MISSTEMVIFVICFFCCVVQLGEFLDLVSLRPGREQTAIARPVPHIHFLSCTCVLAAFDIQDLFVDPMAAVLLPHMLTCVRTPSAKNTTMKSTSLTHLILLCSISHAVGSCVCAHHACLLSYHGLGHRGEGIGIVQGIVIRVCCTFFQHCSHISGAFSACALRHPTSFISRTWRQLASRPRTRPTHSAALPHD